MIDYRADLGAVGHRTNALRGPHLKVGRVDALGVMPRCRPQFVANKPVGMRLEAPRSEKQVGDGVRRCRS